MEKGDNLTESILLDLQTGLTTCEVYNNTIKFNIQQLQKEIIKDKSRTIDTTRVCISV